MKKLLVGVVALPFLAGIASAAQPAALSDAQMDKVTAGESGGESSANGTAFGLGDLGPTTRVVTATYADPINRIAIGQASATSSAESALFQAAAATHIDSAAALHRDPFPH